MEKYVIELSKEQMLLIANCLEDISRFASGQMNLEYTINEMLKTYPLKMQTEKYHKTKMLLNQIKKILLPNLLDNENLGYNNSEFIGNVYQIYRTILYQLAIDNNWNNVYSYPALPSGNMSTIKIKKL